MSINSEITKTIFEREGDLLVSGIKSSLISTGAQATGKTAASLELTATQERLLIFGGSSFGTNQRDGLPYVEGGRGPGTMPPAGPIREWMIARGIPLNLLFVIRRKIAESGTDIWIKNSPRAIVNNVINDEAVESIIEQINQRFADNVLSDIIKSFQN